MESCNVIISDLRTYRRIITFDLVSPLNKTQMFYVETQLKKRERKEEGIVTEKNQTEQEAFGIYSEFLCVDCIAKHQRAERKLRHSS